MVHLLCNVFSSISWLSAYFEQYEIEFESGEISYQNFEGLIASVTRMSLALDCCVSAVYRETAFHIPRLIH